MDILEFANTADGSELVLDIRGKTLFEYGSLKGAIPFDAEGSFDALPKDRKIYIMCRSGEKSEALAEEMSRAGYDAESLEGGWRRYFSEYGVKQLEQSENTDPMMRVMIGMSGGVDSTVTAALLKEQGYDCCGVTLRLHEGEFRSDENCRTCCSDRDIDDASIAAAQMGIPHLAPDFIEAFNRNVIDNFVSVYENGGTPNPCIECNRKIKFGLLMEYAERNGYGRIATGHYVRTEYSEERGRYIMRKGLDETKDQSYVLYMLTQEQLARVIFPLGGMRKTEVRQKAAGMGLVNASKGDSQDICFVPDGDYVSFIHGYTGKTYPEGDFVSPEGKVLGRHRGAINYTIGQRRGLDLPMGQRVYVCGKNMERNEIVVGGPQDLMSRGLIAENVNWLSIARPDGPIKAKVRTRYHQREESCTVTPLEGDRAEIVFDNPMRAVTIGQAAVFYDGDMLLGGGTIETVF